MSGETVLMKYSKRFGRADDDNKRILSDGQSVDRWNEGVGERVVVWTVGQGVPNNSSKGVPVDK